MTELVVNIVLILAVLVLLTASLIGAIRRRRQDRRQHAEERRLIVQAFLGAAAKPTEAVPEPPSEATRAVSAIAPPQHLDADSVATLLDLLEDRRPARRGLFTGLVNGPRSVWAAGARAGQHIGGRTMGRRADGIDETTGPQLYRAAAREILDVHAHDPRDAQLEYRRYTDAVGDPALAELYVRSAAHATYGEPDKARLVVEQITSADSSPRTDPTHPTPTR
jgi:hypothetical protein